MLVEEIKCGYIKALAEDGDDFMVEEDEEDKEDKEDDEDDDDSEELES